MKRLLTGVMNIGWMILIMASFVLGIMWLIGGWAMGIEFVSRFTDNNLLRAMGAAPWFLSLAWLAGEEGFL